MAIVITDIEDIFDKFLSKTVSELSTLYNDTNMEDEQFATIASNVISSAMNSSVNAYDSLKRAELIDAQVISETSKNLDIVSATAVRDAQSTKDLLLKDEQIAMSVAQQASEAQKTLDITSATNARDAQSKEDNLNKIAQRSILLQQEFSEKIKNGIVSIEYTYTDINDVVQVTTDYTTATTNAVGSITSAITTSNTAPSIHQQQANKIAKDSLFVTQQTIELIRSVDFNNKIKALDSYADMIGTMGAGGLVPSEDMWATLFALIKSLSDSATEVEYPEVIAVDIKKM